MGISLEKIEKEAPQLIDLVKKADQSLAKVNLKDHQAKVALCLDISGSMYDLYNSGKIQQFAERILALGTRFDNDGSIDIFLFGKKAHNAGEMNLSNFQNFIGEVQQRFPLEGSTYYANVMRNIRDFYFGTGQDKGAPMGFLGIGKAKKEPLAGTEPVYVMFVTDGASMDQGAAAEQLILASYEPMFWQFMAIGSGNFEFLERLDDLRDRYLDNGDFFNVADPLAIADDRLYDLLMEEYPTWLKAAKEKGILV